MEKVKLQLDDPSRFLGSRIHPMPVLKFFRLEVCVTKSQHQVDSVAKTGGHHVANACFKVCLHIANDTKQSLHICTMHKQQTLFHSFKSISLLD